MSQNDDYDITNNISANFSLKNEHPQQKVSNSNHDLHVRYSTNTFSLSH